MTTAAVADKQQQAREGLRKLDAMRRKLAQAAGVRTEQERKAATRLLTRDLQLPRVVNVERRLACLSDFYLFAATYFPRIFCHPFQPTHRQMVDAIHYAATQGGAQAIAGPRGDGKTTCAAYAGLWSTMRGDIDFTGFVSKNSDEAFNVLDEMKTELRDSDLFGEDFPEVGWVLGNLTTPKTQTVWGRKTNVIWTARTIALPMLPTNFLRANGWNQDIDSCANGGVFSARGWRGGLRGMKIRGRRPQLVIGDDCDNRESSNSETQTKALRDVFERDVAGLGSSRRRSVCVYLGTLINPQCFAAYATDPERKHIWRGIRIPLVTKFPSRLDLWAEYVTLRKGRAEDDPLCRVAYRFYAERQLVMDAGGETTNPHRYSHRIAVDGLPEELSTIQAYYNWVADWGEESALTELQNSPTNVEKSDADGLTPHRIQHQVSGYGRGVIPPKATLLTMGVDVGKFLLHWVVIAWGPGATSWLIDYGTHDVRGTTRGTDEGMEQAVISAIRSLVAGKHDNPYCKPDGEILTVSMTLVDCGWGVTQTAVYAACRDIGQMVETPRGREPDVQPAKGQGDGASDEAGHRAAPWRNYQRRDWDHFPGDNWCRSIQRKDGVFLWLHNAGHWKNWGIQRWLTPIDKPGCRFVWGQFGERDRQHAMDHAQLSYHLCANCYRPEPAKPGVICWGERPGMNGDKDHWQDAQELADVAASAMGVRLDMGVEPQEDSPQVVSMPAAVAPMPAQAGSPQVASPWGVEVSYPGAM